MPRPSGRAYTAAPGACPGLDPGAAPPAPLTGKLLGRLPPSAMSKTSLLFAAVGLLLAALAVPLLRRRIRPNGWYGLRTPATLADEAVWYEANARSGRDLVLLGLFLLSLALLLPVVPTLPPSAHRGVLTAVLIGGVLLAGLVGWRRADRLLAERRGGH